MKNRRNIVEQQNPPQNPNDIWLKDGKFYRSTSQGWTIIDSELEYTNKEAMTADNPKGGTIGIDKESGEPSIYNNVTKQWSPLGGGVTETTWQELKDKRDAGKLTPGALYRITDYQCTTTQENTKSAGHQFDIVLFALSANKLAEEGWAMMHDNIYDVTFTDGVTKKCYVYLINNEICNLIDCNTLLGYSNVVYSFTETTQDLFINILNKTATFVEDSTTLDEKNLQYNYFQNSNLSAWKVWYCLDNDKSRFAWADDSVDEGIPASINDDYFRSSEYDTDGKYAWDTNGDGSGLCYTDKETPEVGDTTYLPAKSTFVEYNTVSSYTPAQEGTGLPNGRGVIYRLIDEFNNDIKYDFKNIQFKRKLTNGQYDENGTETWCYTLNLWYNDMCQDASIVGNTLPNDEGYIQGVYDNVFGYATAYDLTIEGVDTFAFALGNNVVLSFNTNDGYYGLNSNTIGSRSNSNTIGNSFNCNTIGINFSYNTIGDFFEFNMIGYYFQANTIGNSFSANTIGNYFSDNTIGNNFSANMIGNNFNNKTISDDTNGKNYGNNGVELATKNDLN